MKFYLTLFILSFITTYIVREIAIRLNIYDIPVDRSSHTVPTPRGGGIALVVCWYAGIIYEHIFWTSMPTYLFHAFLSGLLIVAIGLADDVWRINPKIKFIFQFTAALLALYFLGGLQKADLGFTIIKNRYILSANQRLGKIDQAGLHL